MWHRWQAPRLWNAEERCDAWVDVLLDDCRPGDEKLEEEREAAGAEPLAEARCEVVKPDCV